MVFFRYSESSIYCKCSTVAANPNEVDFIWEHNEVDLFLLDERAYTQPLPCPSASRSPRQLASAGAGSFCPDHHSAMSAAAPRFVCHSAVSTVSLLGDILQAAVDGSFRTKITAEDVCSNPPTPQVLKVRFSSDDHEMSPVLFFNAPHSCCTGSLPRLTCVSLFIPDFSPVGIRRPIRPRRGQLFLLNRTLRFGTVGEQKETVPRRACVVFLVMAVLIRS